MLDVPLIKPGGGALIPGGSGGGAARPRAIPGAIGIPGGGPAKSPGGGPEGRMPGVMMEGAGPPTPLTGPVKPGAAPGMGTLETGIPRPTTPRPNPGAEMADGSGTRGTPSSGGGGPSTVRETMFSPLNRTKPRTLFSSLSIPLDPFPLIFLNSSQSARIKFMCLSNALKVPTKFLPSCNMILIR